MSKKVKKIALLSGGGDCPGLNAVIRAVTKAAISKYGYEVIGFVYGYRGLYNNDYVELTIDKVEDIYKEGGTILYSSNKDNLFDYLVDDGHGGKVKKDVSYVGVENLKKDDVDVLVVLGGDGTLTSARDFARKGVNVIGIPKTMDNDLSSTDLTYGFISAFSEGTDFIDRLNTTAKSHHRVICCELMGRNAGWIALYAGLAGNASCILIPEIPFSIDNIVKHVKERDEQGFHHTVIAVAEGAKYADGTKVIGKIVKDSPDPIRYSGLAAKVADDLEQAISDHEVRSVNPGHIIRGGDIDPYDRILSIRFGIKALELIDEGKFGNVVSLRGEEMTYTSLEDVIGDGKFGQQKVVDPDGELVRAAKAIGVSFGDE
ncbi:MAG: ATP-dependent 6-phosphofructokinase [Thomasclavelia sp.]|jgi:phosphofructokinase-like protein|nr:ATP-dependent 6-phosphofructokinase [Thomasclavelia sp.]